MEKRKNSSNIEIYSQRDYIFYEATTSICHLCESIVQAKIVLKNDAVYIIKYCPEHGELWSLLEDSAEYHKKKRLYDKPGTKMQIHTEVKKGCPHDCGICPQHEQHGCIGLIEITNKCNLKCPLCYANGGEGEFLTLAEIEEMIDFFIISEGGTGEILQISGGEPTIHPDIIEIIKLAKSKPIKYVMLNTNGIKIAEDMDFVEELSQFNTDGFEVYLQFDALNEKSYVELRGESLLKKKLQAIENLSKFKIPITLVATIENGINDDAIAEIFLFGLNQSNVRGINYQPSAYFGRRDLNNKSESPNGTESEECKFGDHLERVTLSKILKELESKTSGMLKMSDFIPLPCNVERVALTYLYRDKKGSFVPITRNKKIEKHVGLINNTFVFTIEDLLKNAGLSIDSIKAGCDCLDFIKDFRNILPLDFFFKSKEKKKEYIDMNTFRISVSSFVDVFNFDIKSMKKECVHVITKDKRKIPFSAYNMFYRDKQIK